MGSSYVQVKFNIDLTIESKENQIRIKITELNQKIMELSHSAESSLIVKCI